VVEENVPAAQPEHDEMARPVAVEKSPAAQSVQVEVMRPLTAENVPGEQPVHMVLPVDAANWPPGQLKQFADDASLSFTE
jgi:hypothetical protein